MSVRKFIKLVRPDERRRLGRWLVWCMLLAAAINVPFAVSLVENLDSPRPGMGGVRRAGDSPKHWPSKTPHSEPWPEPNYWQEWRMFGDRLIDVRRTDPALTETLFSMRVRWSGWPLPVLEQKRMWWDWDDPALTGPDSSPAMRLMSAGLILNPIIVGGGVYLLLVSTFLAFVIGRRYERMRRGLCITCGYDLTGLKPGAVCPECGEAP